MCVPVEDTTDEDYKKTEEEITPLDRLIEHLQERPESTQDTPAEEM